MSSPSGPEEPRVFSYVRLNKLRVFTKLAFRNGAQGLHRGQAWTEDMKAAGLLKAWTLNLCSALMITLHQRVMWPWKLTLWSIAFLSLSAFLSVCLFYPSSCLVLFIPTVRCMFSCFKFRPTTPVLTTVCSRKPYQLFKVKSSYNNHSFRLVRFCRKEGPLCFQDKNVTIATVALAARIITIWYAIPCSDTLTLDFKAMLVVLDELQIHNAVLLFNWPSSKAYYEFLDRFPHCK